MSNLTELPDVVVQLIVARLDLIDVLSLSCTCSRFFTSATGCTVATSPLGDQQHQQQNNTLIQQTTSAPVRCTPQLTTIAAAAKQRLATAAAGGWRDQLLLTAWRQQQIMAEVAAARANKKDDAQKRLASSLGPADHSSSTVAEGALSQHSPQLQQPQLQDALPQQQLILPQQQQQSEQHTLPQQPQLASAPQQQQQQHMLHSGHAIEQKAAKQQQLPVPVDFSGFFLPVPAVLKASHCFITDGSASAMMGFVDLSSSGSSSGSSSSSDSGSSSSSSSSASVGSNDPASDQGAHIESSVQQQQFTTWKLPLCERPQLSHNLTLIRGHLPPQGRNTNWGPIARPPTVQSILNPNTNPTAAALNHQYALNPVADVMPAAAGRHGLQQLQNFLDHLHQQERQQQQDRWMGLLRDNQQQQRFQQTNATAAAATSQMQQGHDKFAQSSSSTNQQQQQQQPVQVFVLPVPPPPGSCTALHHPWPPSLQPGCTNQGLSGAGQGLGSGYLHGADGVSVVLKHAVLQQQNALVLAGGTGSSFVTGSMLADMPKSFLSSLQHLEISGQHALSDPEISVLLSRTPDLKTLGLADTCAAGATFMMLNPSVPSSSAAQNPSPTTRQTHAVTVSQGISAGGRGLAARVPGGPALSGVQARGTRQGLAACTAAKTLGQMGSGRLGFRLLGQLAVLDVSGCAALSSTEGNTFEIQLFQDALCRLDHLQVLIARRLNVDACFLDTRSSSSSSSSSTSTTHNKAAARGSKTTLQHDATACASAHITSQPLPIPAPRGSPSVSQGIQATLAGLLELDISDAVQLSVKCMVGVLMACQNVKRLGVTGCKTLAAEGGTARLQAALQQQLAAAAAETALQQQQQDLQDTCESSPAPAVDAATAAAADTSAAAAADSVKFLPSLTQLAVGWGWSSRSIALLLANSPCLTHFTAAVGACMSDSVLCMIGSACPQLQQLRLSLCPVSAAGVAAVLTGCRKLTGLQLQQCVGPFDTVNILQTLAIPQQQEQEPQQQQEKQQQHHRWQLSTLQLEGPPVCTSDEQLLQLLAVPAKVKLGQTWSKLVNLCLVRVNGLTDAFMQALIAARCQLQHLKLQECYVTHVVVQSSSSGGSSSSDSSSSGSTLTAAFSEPVLLHLLQICCARSLKSLQLRHAVSPLSSGFVSAAVAAAPLLQLFVLDACDLPDGGVFEFESSPHGALKAIHVMRCRALGQPGIAGMDEHEIEHLGHQHQQQHQPQRQQQQQQQAGCCVRKCDKQLVVHLLHLGRSLHLPTA